MRFKKVSFPSTISYVISRTSSHVSAPSKRFPGLRNAGSCPDHDRAEECLGDAEEKASARSQKISDGFKGGLPTPFEQIEEKCPHDSACQAAISGYQLLQAGQKC
jgi:hypothetical protein